MTELDKTIGSAVRKARERLRWTQAQLAEKAGFGHAQVVSQVEKGERPLKASEIARLSQVLFCDLAGLLQDRPLARAPVLWREEPSDSAEIEARFLQDCQHYRLLEELCEAFPEGQLSPAPSAMPANLDEAGRYGEKVRKNLGLGTYPADSLRTVLEKEYGLKLFFEPDLTGSAACAVGDFGPAVLLNSSQAPWRTNFSLGHELFHLLTLSLASPLQLSGDPTRKKRIEKLANAFASALLLPAEETTEAFNGRVQDGKIHYGDIVHIARLFQVSTEALIWRLVNLDRMQKEEADRVLEDEHFRAMDRETMAQNWPERSRYFPQRFVHLGFLAWQKGKLSRGKLAEFLRVNLTHIGEFLATYGLDEDEDYEATLSVA